jgi:hypothetical protein
VGRQEASQVAAGHKYPTQLIGPFLILTGRENKRWRSGQAVLKQAGAAL